MKIKNQSEYEIERWEIERWENEGGSFANSATDVVSAFAFHHRSNFMTNAATTVPPTHPCKRKGEQYQQVRTKDAII